VSSRRVVYRGVVNAGVTLTLTLSGAQQHAGVWVVADGINLLYISVASGADNVVYQRFVAAPNTATKLPVPTTALQMSALCPGAVVDDSQVGSLAVFHASVFRFFTATATGAVVDDSQVGFYTRILLLSIITCICYQILTLAFLPNTHYRSFFLRSVPFLSFPFLSFPFLFFPYQAAPPPTSSTGGDNSNGSGGSGGGGGEISGADPTVADAHPSCVLVSNAG
jgi:hypothetical protein